MKTIKLVSALILVGTLLTGCSNQDKEPVNEPVKIEESVKKVVPKKETSDESTPNVDTIFTYLSKSGVKLTDKGEQLMASSIGAIEGYYFSTNVADECELYRFKTTEDAEKAKQKIIADGTPANQLYVNGVFLLGVYSEDTRLADIFMHII